MKLKSFITALHAALLCILLAASPAGSGSMTLLGVGPPPVAAGGGFSLTYKSGASSTANTTTINYGTMTWDSGKYLVMTLIFLENNPGTTVSSITVDGVSLTQIAGARATRGVFGSCADMWITPSPMGSSTGNVSVTFSTSPNAFGSGASVALYSLSTTTPTPSDTDTLVQAAGSSTFTLSALTVPSGGGAIVATWSDGAVVLSSWTGAATDANLSASNQYYGHTTATGTNSIVATWGSGQTGVLTGVAWGP